ncbi:hypothetical protein CRG98_002908, partial [Punica granatum]
MDSDYSKPSDGNFGFAFNDSNFSDRMLQIEIIGGPSDCRSDGEGPCTSIADWARLRKRRREDAKKETSLDLTVCAEEQILNQPDMDDCEGFENHDEAVAMVEESPS